MNETASHILLSGSNYEVGKTLGEFYRNNSIPLNNVIINESYLSKEDEQQMFRLFDDYCPGMNEEIAGFAEALKVSPVQLLYYAETYLCPGCSQIALLPAMSTNGHTILARNYDFKDGIEEMSVVTTKIKGKNAHVASSAWIFGRGDGLNEHGLAVSQSGVGIPVTRNMPNTARAAIKGLQFWAVIRSVLENCASVEDAIAWTKDMPIAFNINMMIADQSGSAALIETLNGKKAVKKIDASSSEQYLIATNHAHLEELKPYAPMALKNSMNRQGLIGDYISKRNVVSAEDLQQLLSEQYPAGLSCRYYDYFFGTLRSQIIDVTEGTMSVRWGSPELNEWHTFRINGNAPYEMLPVRLIKEAAPFDFYEMIENN